MLSKQLESMRRSKGWTQAELAHRIHISPSAIGMYEQGRREPSVSILAALANEFGVTIDYLVTGNPYKDADNRATVDLSCIPDVFSMLNSMSRNELIVLLAANLMTPSCFL